MPHDTVEPPAPLATRRCRHFDAAIGRRLTAVIRRLHDVDEGRHAAERPCYLSDGVPETYAVL